MFCIPIQQMCVSMQEFIKHCYFFIGISLSLCPFIIWQLASCRIKSIFSRTFKINNYLSFSIFFNYLSLNLPFKATHFYIITVMDKHRTRKCQCPLGLMTHFYVPLQKPRFYAVSRAYFCRYLSEYSDRSSFSCMFTIWTHLTRQIFPNPEFTISQNYSSVILFFHQNYRRTHSLILSLTPVRNMLRQHLHPLPMDYN